MSLFINDYRFSLVNENILRIEKKYNGAFEDRNTFFVDQKDNLLDLKIDLKEDKKEYFFFVDLYKIVIKKPLRKLGDISVYFKEKMIYRLKNHLNSGELPSLDKTPEVFSLADNPRLIIPDGGYTEKNSSGYILQGDVEDIYLILAKKCAKKLRELYVLLTGRNELVPLSALGAWHSRYFRYDEKSALNLIDEFPKHDVPLDNFVIDTDWRLMDNGIGYDVNESLFPDMSRFLDECHQRNINIMFNDHPEPVGKIKMVFDKEEIKYREENLKKILDMGLDVWWYDRNWSCRLISPHNNISPYTIGLYLYHNVTKRYFEDSKKEKYARRPLIMGNVPQIINGEYISILDSAAHRYSAQWTGDIGSSYESMGKEILSLVRTGNNAFPYCNFDCGGHIGNPTKEEFIRWMQFGNFSPIYRPHSSNSVNPFREPWNYDDETLDIVRKYVKARYNLLPLLYAGAFNSYESGIPFFRSLGFNYQDKKSLTCFNEYMLLNKILIAPFYQDAFFDMKKSFYASKVKGTYYLGEELKGDPICFEEVDKLDWKRDFAPYNDKVPMEHFSARYEFDVCFDKDSYLGVSSDDGTRVYINNKLCLDDWKYHGAAFHKVDYLFKKGAKEHVVIEYMQGGNEASLKLNYLPFKSKSDEKKHVYLPKDRWINPFNGKVITKGKYSHLYKLEEFPIFIREGSLIPLYLSMNNIHNINLKKMVYDFYPSKVNVDEGFIFEDDFSTVAYKTGKYLKVNYETKILEDHVEIIFHPGIGEYRHFKRDIILKIHENKEFGRISKVLINDEEVKIKHHRKDKNAFIFNSSLTALDSMTATIKFVHDSRKEIVIKLFK